MFATIRPNQGKELSLQAEETANDSDKTFTVPAKTVWQIQSIWVELTTTATVGDRQIQVDILDSASDVVGQIRVGVVQAAGVLRYYMIAPGVSDLTAFRDKNLTTPMPALYLPEGFAIRIYDVGAVDAAADDMIVQLMVLQQVA